LISHNKGKTQIEGDREQGREGRNMMASWRKLHGEELQKFYASSNIIRAIKSRRKRWARHMARTG
jgi:hypothetical protein